MSELSPEGTLIRGANNITSLLPAITTRRASTTVQLMDGQSFAIGGLIKNNVSQSISGFPFLSELPILGALFRSSEFINDRSELMFLVTPRLVKPMATPAALPTDGFVPPTRFEFMINGQMQGTSPAPKEPARIQGNAAPVQLLAPDVALPRLTAQPSPPVPQPADSESSAPIMAQDSDAQSVMQVDPITTSDLKIENLEEVKQ